MFHRFLTTSFVFGKVRFQVKVNGIPCLCSLFGVSRFSLFLSNIFDILLYISGFLYPLSIKSFDKMPQLALKLRSSVHFRFRRRT